MSDAAINPSTGIAPPDAGEAQPIDSAIDRPGPLTPNYALAMTAMWLGVWAVIFTPLTLTLPMRLAILDPVGRNEDLSIILSLGAVCAIIVNPIWGMLSDRTRSRFGRRRPWIVVGVTTSAIGLATMALGPNVVVVGVGWCLLQICMNAAIITLQAGIAHTVQPRSMGFVSSIVGLTISVGPPIGVFLAGLVTGNMVAMFFVPLAVAGLALVWILLAMPDQSTKGRILPTARFSDAVRSFWINPLRFPDFGWALLNRVLIYFGYSFFLSFQAFYLLDRMSLAVDDLPHQIVITSTLSGIATCCVALTSGWLSDRLQRRKPFVLGACVVTAIGLMLAATAHDLMLFYVGATLIGGGMGAYLAVDTALQIAVLPSVDDAAKGMGILASAGILGQSLGPIVAPMLLAVGGGDKNYLVLFGVGAIAATLGGLAVTPIRSTR